MKEIVTNYDNFLNPNEALREYMPNLLDLYIDDYGKDNIKLIKERIKKTMYIFDSLPIDELNFFEKHKHLIDVSKKIDLAVLECRDFYNKKLKVDETVNKKLYEALADAFGVSGRFIDELFSLDIDSYSFDNKIALVDENTPLDIKEEIRKRQEEYKQECARLGIECLTNSKVIEKLFILQDNLELETNFYLACNTKWAKKIKKRIFEEKGQCISNIDLMELLFYENGGGSSNLIDTGKKEKLRICYFPLLSNTERGNLDGMFFHENRHVIEMTDLFAGIQCFSNGRYSLLNEIRTEKNAIRDKKQLEGKVLFSNFGFSEGVFNVYEKLFAYTEGFFDEYMNILNRLAVRNNIKDFERLFGRKSLNKFDIYLHSIEDAIMNDSGDLEIICDEREQKRLVKKLRERYESRH